ncbi:MAG TPA: hypothetical protein DIT48_06310, partial [Actinobacteria bacterium]|nr:hypothetical protein [Actinomycetota bacterium]
MDLRRGGSVRARRPTSVPQDHREPSGVGRQAKSVGSRSSHIDGFGGTSQEAPEDGRRQWVKGSEEKRQRFPMKGHIFRRGKNWTIVYDGERHENGDRNQIWVTVHGTKKDAERELVRILHEQQSGTDLEPSTVTVAKYLERWLADGAAASVAPKTFERYSEIVRLHLIPALGHHRLARLKPLHIQGYYGEALKNGRRDGKGGLAPRTVLHHHRVLHRALSRAVKWRLLAVNPADAVEPPRATSPEMQTLTEEEIGLLLATAVATPSYTAILLAVTTGVRRGELLALRWADA